MGHTRREYSAFERAYDYFNEALFKGELPGCLITLQRKACILRSKTPAGSARRRPPIPIDSDHLLRLIAPTHYEEGAQA